MLPKPWNWLEKTLFTVVLFLLTDKFGVFFDTLSHTPVLRNAVSFVANVHGKDIGPTSRALLNSILPILLDAAVVYIILVLCLRSGLFTKISKAFLTTGLAVLLIFAGASWFWSVSASATLDGLFLVLKITLVGIYISQKYTPEEILDLLVGVITIASVLSIFAVWLAPKTSLHLGGEWRGIYDWKNFLGRLMAFGNAILIVYWFENRTVPKRIFALCLFLLTAALLVFTRSTTSLILWFAMCGGIILYGLWTKWITRFSAPAKWSLVVLMISVAGLAAWKHSVILALLNKTSTLTGRTALWEILWGWFQKSPIIGFGYEAFWAQFPNGIRPPGPGWADGPAIHAHNGYFDIALALGGVGLLLFLFIAILSWKNALTLLAQRKQIIWLWPLLALFYFTFANLTYSIAFALPDFHWALFVIVAGLVASNARQLFANPPKITTENNVENI